MKRILVLGGYGGFGARLSILLARRAHEVFVGGRRLARAQRFCAAEPDLNLQPIEVDRLQDLKPLLRDLRPWLVIDAAGPFQGSDHRVPESCIAEGCHYADLADARDFVCGVADLDGPARRAGVTVIAGASSLPALTSAVVDRLAVGLGRLSFIDIALSASNRASASRSVTAAILSYVGKPIQLWRGGRWREGIGWQELRRLRFAAPGGGGFRRHVALCDVPDLSLLPDLYPGRPSVRFRAGSELAVQNLGLWLLSWLVRWSWLRSLSRFTPVGLWVQKLLRGIGGDRSAMTILVKGWQSGRAVERCWTVFAEKGHGPWIPSLAVPLLVDRLAEGSLATGARSAAGILELAAFERAFADFAITTEMSEREVPPLYQRIMRDGFRLLPECVRAMHEVNGDLGAAGVADVERGRGMSRLIGRLLRMPEAGEGMPLHVWMSEEGGIETWHRDFGGAGFSSRLYERDGWLIEQFGLVRCAMELRNTSAGLSMHLRRWWLGPLPLPLALGPRFDAREADVGGVFHFDVSIRLPFVGFIVRYSGRLSPTAAASAAPAGRPDPRFPPARSSRRKCPPHR